MSFAAVLSALTISLGSQTFDKPANAAANHNTQIAIAKTNNTKAETVSKPEAPKPVMVTVQPGDSLEKIAAANNTTYLRLFYANTQIAQPDLIYPNQQLRVPAADEALTPRDLPTPAPVPAPAAVAAAPEASAAPTYRAPVSTAPAVAGGGVWDRLAACESGGNWAINTGNGFYGGLQFTLSSWHAVGGSGYPNQASRDEQIARAQILQSRGGWGNWPACASKLGLL
jgi:LysM repeat protein